MSRPEVVKFSVLAGIVAIVILLPWLGRPVALILTLAILGRCAFELYGSLRTPSPAFRTAVCFVYMLLGTAFLCFAIVLSLRSMSYVCLIVIAFSLRRYVPQVGLVGGAAAALALALAARGGIGLVGALEAWVLITAAALAGSMVASWVRYKGGIKGFGRSGTQGVLDYFDGFLFAAPVALAFLS
jgi:CDP-diglyceride synthetase